MYRSSRVWKQHSLICNKIIIHLRRNMYDHPHVLVHYLKCSSGALVTCVCLKWGDFTKLLSRHQKIPDSDQLHQERGEKLCCKVAENSPSDTTLIQVKVHLESQHQGTHHISKTAFILRQYLLNRQGQAATVGSFSPIIASFIYCIVLHVFAHLMYFTYIISISVFYEYTAFS